MKKISINSKQKGQRLDKFLKQEIFCNYKISRGEIIRKIKNGKVLINGQLTKPSYALKEKDELEIETGDRGSKSLFPNPDIRIKIIFENDDFLVIDKPAGIQIHPDAHEKKNTIVNWLIVKYPKIRNVHDSSHEAELRPGIVHRLDKDTSGLLVIAKNQKTFNLLKKIFQSRKVKKTYLAIVQGKMEEQAGVIEKPIAKAANYKKQVIASSRTRTKARPAFTGYRVLEERKGFSLLEVFIKTGRTHQIRIHLWSIGHPVVGDKIYKRQGTRDKKQEANVFRQLLHAKKLEFSLGKEKYAFQSPLPTDFRNFLKDY